MDIEKFIPYLAVIATIMVFAGLVLLVVMAWRRPIETLIKGIVVPLIFIISGFMFWVIIWAFGWMTPWLSNTGVSSLEKIVSSMDSRTFKCEYHGTTIEGPLEDWYTNFDPDQNFWKKFLRLNPGIVEEVQKNPDTIKTVVLPMSVKPDDPQVETLWCHEDWYLISP